MGSPEREKTNLLLSIELLRSKVERLETARPVAYDEPRSFANLYSIRLHHCYTVPRACQNWGISEATLYRHLHPAPAWPTQDGQAGILQDAEFAARIPDGADKGCAR